MDASFIERINQQRLELSGLNPITAFQIGLHMAHRIAALVILALVAGVVWVAWRQQGREAAGTRAALGWLGIISLQAGLGIITVLSNKAADVATAHVMFGSLTLLCGTLLSLAALPSRAKVPRPKTSAAEFEHVGATLSGRKSATAT
jgi:cytochrome c oxidase assembly protein subunit 15